MFEIYKSEKSGEFYFRLKNDSDKIILSSEGYKAKTSCTNGVESVKKNAENENRFEVKEAKDGRKHFNLKATNGQVIGKGAMYETDEQLKEGMAEVQKFSKGKVNDLTA